MDQLRLIAAGMILLSSSWIGLHAALRLRRTDTQLRALCAALTRMNGELTYAATPFAPLCAQLAAASDGAAAAFFHALAQEAAAPGLRGIGLTERAARQAGLTLPSDAMTALSRLFDSFGQSDLETQLAQLRLASAEVEQLSAELRTQIAGKCRSYKLLGVMTGAAILVLVL